MKKLVHQLRFTLKKAENYSRIRGQSKVTQLGWVGQAAFAEVRKVQGKVPPGPSWKVWLDKRSAWRSEGTLGVGTILCSLFLQNISLVMLPPQRPF